jgi:hypothetical protein
MVDEVYKSTNIECDPDYIKGTKIYNEEQLRLSFIKDKFQMKILYKAKY